MGVHLCQWRICIGLFVVPRSKCIRVVDTPPGANVCRGYHMFKNENFSVSNVIVVSVVLCSLLIIAGIETNPGPKTVEDAIQESNAQFQALTDLINNRNAETISAVNEVKTDVSSLSKKFDELTQEVGTVRTRMTSLEDANRRFKKRVEELETQSRKNNVIVFGLDETLGSISAASDFCNFARTHLDVVLSEDKVDLAYRMGKITGKRPLFVALASSRTKSLIMDKVIKLKGTKIVGSEDLTRKERSNRKKLLQFAAEARTSSHSVKLRRDAIIIDDTRVHLDALRRDGWKKAFESTKLLAEQPAADRYIKRQRQPGSSSEESDEAGSVTGADSEASGPSYLSGNIMGPPQTRLRGKKKALSQRHKRIA